MRKGRSGIRSAGILFFEKRLLHRGTATQCTLKPFTLYASLLIVLMTAAQAEEQNLTAQLRDIKPLLEIPDSSFYFYWGLLGFGLLLVGGILFFAIKKILENRKVNLAKKYLAALKAIDWNDSKKSAYQATQYARLLATDARKKELFFQLETMLEKYKYKKEVEALDDETRNQFNLFVQVADESI